MRMKILSLRLPESLRRRFNAKAQKFGKAADVHRELLEAFVEDRMTIRPNPNKPSLENLYVDREPS